ncbi:MAG: glycosyltransferase family 39 protein [Deltaproteobacteria bacterium]|nr:glycosyltransferase family 39 protein [Deltaproteobacteria bacterium]
MLSSRALRSWLTWELAAFVLAVSFRLAAPWFNNSDRGYDVEQHVAYMQYIADHKALPPLGANWTAKHPPLYYGLTYGLNRLGLWPNFETKALQILSLIFAVLRLGVFWWGLRRFVASGHARVWALLLAGLLPCVVHGDGMVNNEVPNWLFGTLAIILMVDALRAAPTIRQSILLGLSFLLALMTKVTGILLGPAAAVGLGLSWWWLPKGERKARILRPAVAVAVAFAVSLPVYARHYETSGGKIFPTWFDRSPESRAELDAMPPYLERRTARYLFAPTFGSVWEKPWFPHAEGFWPILIASTFSDYYNYAFVAPRPGEENFIANYRPLALRTLNFMRATLPAGIAIALFTAIAFAVIALRSLRERDAGALAALSVSALVLLGQLHFAIRIPKDDMGVVKGSYLQFGTAPLFVVWGLGMAWLYRRGGAWRAVFGLQAVALLTLLAYDLHAFWIL